MLLLAHEVAGRLRFVSPELKNDRQRTSQLLRLVRAVPGVTEVRVRNHSGSLIVLYDGVLATRNAVLQSLPVMVTSDETRNRKRRLSDEVAEVAAQKLLSIVARRVIAALF